MLSEYKDQIILQVSIATLNKKLASTVEPRAPSPESRLKILRKAKDAGLKVGVIVAPVLPSNKIRFDVKNDLEKIIEELYKIGVDQIFGEMLHQRGINLEYLSDALGEKITADEYNDRILGKIFEDLLSKYNLNGKWWYEFH